MLEWLEWRGGMGWGDVVVDDDPCGSRGGLGLLEFLRVQ